jgi:hypothetical protein
MQRRPRVRMSELAARRGRNAATRRALAAAAALLVAGVSARADPPADADGRYSGWFAQLKSRDGGSCCDVADCRFVGERIVAGRYEVRFHEPDASAFPRGWITVPDDAVRPRPPGGPATAVACWFDDRVYCFFGEPES